MKKQVVQKTTHSNTPTSEVIANLNIATFALT